MESLRLILSIFVAIFIGWNMLYLISFKNTKLFFLEKLLISYGLGFGFISLEMFMFHFFDLKFSLFSILICWVPFVVAAILISPRRRDTHIRGGSKPFSVIEKFLICAISFEVIYALFRALIRPIEAYDAIATFAIKSKIFYLAKSISHDYFYNLGLLFPHVDYPLNVPLSETFIYLFLGNLNDQLVKIIFPLYFIAILGILYCGVRRFGSRSYALMFTFALATIPQFSNFATNAYVDVPLSYYFLTGTLFLFYWFKKTEAVGFLYISAMITALSGWTKNEGLVYCAINIIVLLAFFLSNRKNVRGRDVAHGFGYIIVMAVIILPWLVIRRTAHVVNYDFGILDVSRFNIMKQSNRILPMLYEFQRQVFGPKKWNIFWIILISALIIYRKKIFAKDLVFITMPILLIFGSYILAYLVAQTEMTTLWSRMLIHFLPLSVFWLALLVKDDIKI